MGCVGNRRAINIDQTDRIRKLSKHSSIDLEINEEIYIPSENIQDLYKIEKQLGKGRFGAVYLGTSTLTSKKLAIKIQSHESSSSITSELKIIKKLDHPNILKCFETFQDSKFFYIVSEYCSGGELLTKNSSIFPENTAKNIIFKLLSATCHMHSLNIVHRDLKPENILFDSEGDVKIIDFGLSVVANNSKLTDVVGTPLYMAPEVANSLYGRECDLWSIGIIMHCLLLGKAPNDGFHKQDILKRLKNGKVEIDQEAYTQLNADAQNLLFRLLHRNPSKRITALEAVGHRWFSQKIDRGIPKEVLAKVRANFKLSRAQYLILKLGLQGLSNEQTLPARELFKSIDVSKSGFVKIEASGMGVQLSYTEFLISMLREVIIESSIPTIYNWCSQKEKFDINLLRNSLCRSGVYISHSLLPHSFSSLSEFQKSLL